MKLDWFRIRKQIGIVALTIVMLLIVRGFRWMIYRHFGVQAIEPFEQLAHRLNVGIIIWASFAAGLLATRLHPLLLPKSYLQWLMTTPWKPGMRLPLGEPYPIAQDVWFVATMELLGVFVAHLPFGFASVAIMMGYTLGTLAVLAVSEQMIPALVMFYALPLFTWIG